MNSCAACKMVVELGNTPHWQCNRCQKALHLSCITQLQEHLDLDTIAKNDPALRAFVAKLFVCDLCLPQYQLVSKNA